MPTENYSYKIIFSLLSCSTLFNVFIVGNYPKMHKTTFIKAIPTWNVDYIRGFVISSNFNNMFKPSNIYSEFMTNRLFIVTNNSMFVDGLDTL